MKIYKLITIIIITLTLANCGKKLEIDDLTKSEWTEKNSKKAKYKIKFKFKCEFKLSLSFSVSLKYVELKLKLITRLSTRVSK